MILVAYGRKVGKNWICVDKQNIFGLDPVNHETSKQLLKLTKPKLNQIIQLITGHDFNNYNLRLISEEHNDMCRYCCRVVEETLHLVMECEKLTKVRLSFLAISGGKPTIGQPQLPEELIHLQIFLPHLVDGFCIPAYSNSYMTNRDGSIPQTGTAQSD